MKSRRHGLMLSGLTALILLGTTTAWALPSAPLESSLQAVVAQTPLPPMKNDKGEEMKPPFKDQEQAQCVSKCQEPMTRCMNRCKKGDSTCVNRCAEKTMSCNRGCGMRVPNPNDVRNAQGHGH